MNSLEVVNIDVLDMAGILLHVHGVRFAAHCKKPLLRREFVVSVCLVLNLSTMPTALALYTKRPSQGQGQGGEKVLSLASNLLNALARWHLARHNSGFPALLEGHIPNGEGTKLCWLLDKRTNRDCH